MTRKTSSHATDWAGLTARSPFLPLGAPDPVAARRRSPSWATHGGEVAEAAADGVWTSAAAAVPIALSSARAVPGGVESATLLVALRQAYDQGLPHVVVSRRSFRWLRRAARWQPRLDELQCLYAWEARELAAALIAAADLVDADADGSVVA